jgi:hypothetical protein
MSAPVASFELKDGTQLMLFPNRVVHDGGGLLELVPLAHLASVRVAFERDQRMLNRAGVLFVIAFFLLLISGPLLNWSVGTAAQIVGNDSLQSVLRTSLGALAGFARLLPWIAALLAAGGAALAAIFVIGATVLTLSFGAAERSFAMRGRNRPLVEFAEVIGEHLARQSG